MQFTKFKQKALIMFYAILTTLSFTFNLTDAKSIINLESPLKGGTFLAVIITLALYHFYQKFYLPKKQNHWSFRLLAFLFALFMVFGNSYQTVGSWDLVFGNLVVLALSIIFIIGYYLFFNCFINLIFTKVIKNDFLKEKMAQNKVLDFIFNKHPFICTFLILFICWLPYLIAFYPAILSPDPSFQIQQFFGIRTKYSNYANLLDESVTITNHHPVVHTCLLGSLVYLGRLLGSDNLGLFFYSLLQMGALISLFAYIMHYFKKINVAYPIRIATLLIYALVPVFPFYAMSAVKDVFFAVFVIFYMLKLYDLIKDANQNIYKPKTIITLIITMLLITLFRNNGIYLILMSFPFLLLIDHKNRLTILITLLCPVVLYFSFTHILLPTLKITPGSPREMLSIPFQQTARYVKYYGAEITTEEKKAIDKVLKYDTLASRYQPEISDPVKNKFNKDATKTDLQNYFKTWLIMFGKHPNIYIEATIHNTYGYFYPNAHNWYIYYKYDHILKDTGKFAYHYNNLAGLRTVLSGYGLAFPYIPLLGLIVNIGFSTWICMLIFVFLIRMKKYRYLIYLTPVISLVLVCMASPVNTYFRYTLGYVFALPLIIAIFMDIVKKNKGEINYE